MCIQNENHMCENQRNKRVSSLELRTGIKPEDPLLKSNKT